MTIHRRWKQRRIGVFGFLSPKVFSSFKSFNRWWLWLSVASNALLIPMVAMLVLSQYQLPDDSQATASTSTNSLQEKRPIGQRQAGEAIAIRPGLAGEDVLLLARQDQWTYQEWVEQLRREAIAAANNGPPRLTVLAGDSLSLWFPVQLLPEERTWLNQGISGETSSGLLSRLYVFDGTSPETIFVMIGINDLVRGYDDETVLENQRQIIRELLRAHPKSQIVVQSILPHSGNKATWENSDRLLDIPNSRIREINRRLKAIADFEGAFFLDLHPLFASPTGFLRPEFSTDGLHLNDSGYLVWRTAIKLYSQMKLEEPE
ncbi:MAG: SGNH/GDSL hydrolase family protein [Cyanobacteriota bacterium]|nr:SGNH/GDSL hydrolase family protein [Cyanobacteriota bacterium]